MAANIKYFGEEALSTLVRLVKTDVDEKVSNSDLKELTEAEINSLFEGMTSDEIQSLLDNYYSKEQINIIIARLAEKAEFTEIDGDFLAGLWLKG